ncbi:MAG: LytR C-terminal domain-containing protein [Spirochaetota bacterium]|nr:LytR C-terminal domain-containing protein [Spirochaetota bacterium]
MKRGFILIGLATIILFIILFILYYNSIFARNSIEKLIQNKKMINVLIAGSNVFNDNKHQFYGILSINPENERIGFTIIPPNLTISIDSRSKALQRISQIDINNFKKLSTFLNQKLQLNIPFYIELYSPDVERLVDIIEGIDLYVIYQIDEIDGIEYGLNYFDGMKTIKYINSAEENSIFIKYDRIQDILLTLFYNKNKYKKYVNIKLISEALKTIKTNLVPQEAMTIIDLLYKKSDLICAILPGQYNDGFLHFDDISYKIYEKEFLTKLVFNNEIESSMKVKILNGSGISGMARKMRNLLVREGLNVVEFGTSPYPIIDHSIIINQKGDIGAVKRVSELIGVNRIYHIIDNMQLSSVLLIVGKDFAR